MKILGTLLTAMAVCLTAGAASEEITDVSQVDLTSLSLEQLLEVPVVTVEGASRYEQTVEQAPASVTIVTFEEIKRFGHRTLADVLRSIAGFYVTDDRNYGYLGVRGFNRSGDYNSRILVLIDGHRLNENVFDSVLLGTEEVLDVDLIDRVEIIRGPSSSVYGNNALFGVINIITQRGRHLNGAEASMEGGYRNTYKARVSYGRRFDNDLEWYVSGSIYDSAGDRELYYKEFDDPATNDGIARNSDEDRAYRFFSSLAFQDFTLSGLFSLREKNVPTASFQTVFNDGREDTTDSRAYLDLKYRKAVTENAEWMARAFYDYYDYDGTYPYDYADPGDPPFLVLNRDDARGQWFGLESQWTQKVWDRHTLVGGVEYRENFQQDQWNYDQRPRVVYLNDERSSRNFGLYGQAEVTLVTNLLLNAGLRYDHFESFGGTVNPRAALIYNPWEWTTLKFLYGDAYRAPNNFELYYELPFVAKSNPDLDPETIRTYEVVLNQCVSKKIRLGLSGFIYEIKNLISQTTDSVDGLTYFENLERVKSKGIEGEVETRPWPGWSVRANYTFQDSENEETDLRLANSPRHLAKLNLIAPLMPDRIFAGFELQYYGDMKTGAGTVADDFWLANLTFFSRDLLPRLEASATIYNLFNTRYSYPATVDHVQDVIPQDGIGFRVKLTYRF